MQRIGMNWWLVLAAAVLPLLVAVPAAMPFWKRGTAMTGAVVGAGILFVACLAFFLLEGSTLTRQLIECELARVACVAEPQPFTRFFIYGAIAMAQAMGLFVLDHRAEQKRKAAEFSSQWQ